jgi:DNA-binding response OmpR family regulator
MPALEGIPIIIITARDLSMERESLAHVGAHAMFQKPFDYDDLVAAIRSGLGE